MAWYKENNIQTVLNHSSQGVRLTEVHLIDLLESFDAFNRKEKKYQVSQSAQILIYSSLAFRTY